MTHLFKAELTVRIKVQGCPESGLAALDYRRTHGLEERLDNRADVTISGDISEDDFRALLAAGYSTSSDTDGSQTVRYASKLEREYNPLSTSCYGHCSPAPVRTGDSPVVLACRAYAASMRLQRRAKLGADKLEAELVQLEARAAEIRAELGGVL